jgi:hypothetical protein
MYENKEGRNQGRRNQSINQNAAQNAHSILSSNNPQYQPHKALSPSLINPSTHFYNLIVMVDESEF